MIDATTIRDEAYRRIPGYVEADAELDLASEPLPALDGGKPASFEFLWDQAVKRGVAAVSRREPIPADIAHEIFAADMASREQPMRERIRRQIIGLIEDRRERTFANGVDAALEFLSDALDDLVAETNQVAPALGTARTEQDAADFGKKSSTAWSRMILLTDCYDTVRRVQLELCSRKIPHLARPLIAKVGIYRNSIDTVTYWLERRQAAALRSRHPDMSVGAERTIDWLTARPVDDGFDTGEAPTPSELASPVIHRITGTRSDTRPPTAPRRRPIDPWWPTADQVDHLIQTAHDAMLWLPSTDTLTAVHDAALTATTDVNYDVTPEQEEARAEYFSLTGIEDAADIPTVLPAHDEAEPNPWQSVDPAFEKRLRTERVRSQIRAARAL